MISEKSVYQRLSSVIDPELHVDIVSLGLIYDVQCLMDNGQERIVVTMTLTTPGCPLAPLIEKLIIDALAPLQAEVKLKLVWDPAWTQDRMSANARLELGMI